jgi:DNA mismatch repair ATPase MutS
MRMCSVLSVVNQHVMVHESAHDLTMLYTLASGPADRSYGIHVAKLVHFPPSIIDAATHLAAQIETFRETAEESKENSAESDSNITTLTSNQQLLLSDFQRSFTNADAQLEAGILSTKLTAFKAEHDSLITAINAQQSQKHLTHPSNDMAAMDESA